MAGQVKVVEAQAVIVSCRIWYWSNPNVSDRCAWYSVDHGVLSMVVSPVHVLPPTSRPPQRKRDHHC